MKDEMISTRPQEITQALSPAYANASKLKLSKAEAKRLMRPFPDTTIEIRPDNGSLYVPHIFLSERLNQIFRPGNWTLICRNHEYNEDEGQIRAEFVLIVRGCFIGEEVGDHPFNALNGKKYSDALAFIAAKALRRICGLKFSCGSQLWEPQFCQRWIKKYAEQFTGDVFDGRQMQKALLWRKKGSKSVMDEFSETVIPKKGKMRVDENMRDIMLQCLSTQGKENVLQFAIAEKILKKGQKLEDWPLEQVATTEADTRSLQLRIQEHFAPKVSAKGDWREFIIPFGALKGKTLGSVETEMIAGYWEAFHPSTKGVPNVRGCVEFKAAVDAAAKHFNFQKLKGKTK